ncbi:hypothetical protein [Celeribacter sp. ULVN23_4]
MNLLKDVRFAVLLGAVLTGGISAKVVADEYASFRNLRASGDDAFLYLRQNESLTFSPWALRTQTQVLEMCNEALIAPMSAVVSQESYHRVAAQCLGYATEIAEQVPVWGLGQFSIARAAFASGDLDGARAALSLSAELSSYEGWIARKRVLLAFDPRWEMAPETLGDDLVLLLHETEGQGWLARLFLSRPETREVILAVAETLPMAAQRGFLNAVRKARLDGA